MSHPEGAGPDGGMGGRQTCRLRQQICPLSIFSHSMHETNSSPNTFPGNVLGKVWETFPHFTRRQVDTYCPSLPILTTYPTLSLRALVVSPLLFGMMPSSARYWRYVRILAVPELITRA